MTDTGAAIDPEVEADFVFGHRYPERLAVYARIAEASAAAVAAFDPVTDLAYGEHPRERLDLFPGDRDAPLVVFIHGGYWRSQDRTNYRFVAPELLRRGFSIAVLGYPLAPEVKVGTILERLRAAIAWLQREGRRYGVDPARPILCGHSAGGHLAAALAGGLAGGLLPTRGCACLSGIFDLRPILRSSINADVRLDPASATVLSPLLRPPPAEAGWLLAAFGDAETPPFRLQAEALGRLWRDSGRSADVVSIRDANHYTILLDLAAEGSRVAEALRRRVADHGG